MGSWSKKKNEEKKFKNIFKEQWKKTGYFIQIFEKLLFFILLFYFTFPQFILTFIFFWKLLFVGKCSFLFSYIVLFLLRIYAPSSLLCFQQISFQFFFFWVVQLFPGNRLKWFGIWEWDFSVITLVFFMLNLLYEE